MGDPGALDLKSYAKDLLKAEILRQAPDQPSGEKLYAMTLAHLQERHPSFFVLVCPTYFTRLEVAGKVTLDLAAREEITAALALPAAVSDATSVDAVRVGAARKLLPLLRDDELVLQKKLAELITLSEIEAAIFSKQRTRSQATTMVEVSAITLLQIYNRAGGKVSFQHKDQRTYQGPVPDFLAVAWEALPRKHRRTSEQAFIALAAKAWRVLGRTGTTPGLMKILDEVAALAHIQQPPAWLDLDLCQARNKFGGSNK